MSDKQITVEELRVEKENLENAIIRLLHKFTERTDVEICGLTLISHDVTPMNQDRSSYVFDATVELDL